MKERYQSGRVGVGIDGTLPSRLQSQELSVTENLSRPTIESILEVVSDYYGITSEEILSDSRKAMHTMPRHVAVLLASQYVTPNLKNLGEKFNGRDHTTIHHSLKLSRNLASVDPGFKRDVSLATQRLAQIFPAFFAEEEIKISEPSSDLMDINEGPTADIINAACNFLGVEKEDLLSPERGKQEISYARQIAIFLIRELGLTTAEIGQIFGGREESTITAAIQRVKQMCSSPSLATIDIDQIRKILKVGSNSGK